jgi:NADH:ubiquinone oxidoreductase subunit
MENFFKYYESLEPEEKQVIRKRLTKACIIEPPTWYSWMQKRAIPKPSQKLIALELGQDMNELFPKD